MYPQEYIAYGAGSEHAIELTPSNNKRYKFTDHLGTTRLVVNDRNALVTQRDTKPFGGELFLFGVDTRKGFIDKETDTESGLSDFSARKYDNDLGLFLSSDPQFENFANYSPFSYSANNPLRLIDPNGEEWFDLGEGDPIYIEDTESITVPVRDDEGYVVLDEHGNIVTEELKGEKELLYFDGETFTYMMEDGTKQSWEAWSGRENDDERNSYAENAETRDVGPSPGGTHWYIVVDEIQYWRDVSFFDRQASRVGRGTWRYGTRAWGEARVIIHPTVDPTTGRDNMFIHGGNEPGSGGCIDLMSPNALIALEKIDNSNQKIIKLIIRY